MFDFLNVPIGWIIKVCYDLTENYALALLLFALAFQIILLPFGIKQQKNSIKQARLDPKIRAIRKKYAGRNDQVTQQKMQNETMELYQKEGFNPMGGCLPLLIQMPILLALYNVVLNPLKYICGFSTEVINGFQATLYNFMNTNGIAGAEKFAEGVSIRQIDLLTKMKEMVGSGFGYENYLLGNGEKLTEDILPNFTAFGMDLSQTPSFNNFGPLLLVPLITLIVTLGSTFITRKLTYNPNPDQSNNPSMKIMQFSMPLLSTWISFTVAGAVGVYWIFRNILSVIQQAVLYRIMPVPHFTEEDYKAAEKEMNVKPARKKEKGTVRSLHRIDEEDDEVNTPTEKKEIQSGKKKISEEAPKLKDESDRKKDKAEVKEETKEATEEDSEKSE